MKNEVAAKNNTAVGQVLDFSGEAGQGMEGADKDSFALPFITVLQGLSPQIETVEGAKPGLFINTITNALYKKVNVVPVAFQRRYLAWQPRDHGGGFRGSFDVAAIETDPRVKRDEDGKLIDKDGNILKDTRIHYVLVLNDDGSYSPAIVSLSSTQIKKSKRWLSRIQGLQLKDSSGRLYTPPSFSHIYVINSIKESNDSGTWYGYDIDIVSPVADPELYAAAKALHKQVQEGLVQASAPPESQEVNDKF